MINIISLLIEKQKVKTWKKQKTLEKDYSKHGRACETCKFYREKAIYSYYSTRIRRKCLIKVKDVGGSSDRRKEPCAFYKIHPKYKKIKKG